MFRPASSAMDSLGERESVSSIVRDRASAARRGGMLDSVLVELRSDS